MRNAFAIIMMGLVAGCAPGHSVVEAVINSDIPIMVSRFTVDVLNSGQTAHGDYPEAAPVSMPPTHTLAMVFDKDRKGPIHLTVEAFDDKGVSLGKGSGDGDVEPSQSSTVSLTLIHGIHPGDMGAVDMPIDSAGVTDMEMPDISIPPDLTVIPDLTFVCHTDNDCGNGKLPKCNVLTGQCVNCIATDGDAGTTDTCGANQVCVLVNLILQCQQGCKLDADCPKVGDGGVALKATTCCDHLCVDVTSDNAHCGACGKACPNKDLCCNSACLDSTTDVNNCGGCGIACPIANDTASCSASMCGIAMCGSGFADCDKNSKNGCEINLQTDVKNCGGCVKTCAPANAIPVCTSGTCQIQSCNNGFTDCDKNPVDGCEINTAGDINNCGGCAKVCALANATPGCTAGMCTVMGCTQGFADCNNTPGDGCEINLTNNVTHCGMCSTACAAPNGTPECTASKCAVASCNNGFADCDKDPANGCEINTTNDKANCKTCGNVCNLANAVQSCVNSACAIASCVAGFADCNNTASDGCEINLTNDSMNCGKCGTACTAGQVCSSSKCLDQVLIVGTDSLGGAGLADVKAKLVGTNTFSKVEVFDAGSATPTLQQLTPYSALLAYSDPSTAFADPSGTGNALGSFLELGQGRRVVVAAMADYKFTPLQGKITTYMLLDTGGGIQPNGGDSIHIPNANMNTQPLTGVMTIVATNYQSHANNVNGGTQLAAWTNSGMPFVVTGTVRVGGNMINRVDLNFFPVSDSVYTGAWNHTGDGAILLKNALIYK